MIMNIDSILTKLLVIKRKITREKKGNLDNILKNDYTIEDFKKEPFERKLEILTMAVNTIPKSLLLLSLEPGRVYTSGSELLESLLKYLNISIEEFRRNKEFYKNYMPIGASTYWGYVSTDTWNGGIMTKINLTTRVHITPEEVGYALTSFGRDMQPFVAYILKRCAKYEINPWVLFGRTSGPWKKRIPVISVEILKNIYEKEEVKDESKVYTFKGFAIYTLNRFKQLGLIEKMQDGTFRITKKGRRVYKEIIRPILEVATNPHYIIKYRAKLSNKDKQKLLEIYSNYKSLCKEKERSNCYVSITENM